MVTNRPASSLTRGGEGMRESLPARTKRFETRKEVMNYRFQIGAMTLGLLAASIAGCADDATPNRPQDQNSSGGSAGKTNSSAGATSKGGTATSSGGTTVAAGQSATTGVVAGTTGVAGASSSAAGNTGVAGGSSTGGAAVNTAGTTATGTGGATSVGGVASTAGGVASTAGGVASTAGVTSKGGNSTTGGTLNVAGAAGKAAAGTGGMATPGAAGTANDIGAAGSGSVTPSCTIYVNANGGNDWNEGNTWATARATVQSGIDKAQEQGGCDVWVVAGTYKPTSSTVRTVSIILRSNIRVFGGFFGTETSLAQRDFAKNATTLSGDIGVTGDATDNSNHVVTGAEGATIDGFTITGGNGYGGGVYNIAPLFTVRNCVITKNQVTAAGSNTGGAGIYNTGTSLLLQDTTVAINSASGSAYGGGAYLNSQNATVAHCHFDTNSGYLGGGIHLIGTGARVVNSTFVGNSASVGGAISVPSGSAIAVESSAFSNNSAAVGAAMYGEASTPASFSITRSAFGSNTATQYGGAIAAASLTAQLCTFTGNSATSYAGAVYLNGPTLSTITNSVFYGNTSGTEGGGAIYLYDNTKLKVVNSTIARNASSIGGAVFNRAVTSQLTLLNSILWQNTPDEVNGGLTTATYTINTGSNLVGTGNSGSNPLFVDAATGDLRLKTGSLALNAGTATGAPTVDLLGVARDATPDIGAYEGAVSE